MKKGLIIALIAMGVSVVSFAAADGNGNGKDKGKKECCEQKKCDAEKGTAEVSNAKAKKKGKAKGACCDQKASTEASATSETSTVLVTATEEQKEKPACCSKGEKAETGCADKKN